MPDQPNESRTRVLVTGATGFLGSTILKALMQRPDVEPVAACRTPERLVPEFSGETRPGDLLDPDYRRSVVEGIDVICHAGTWSAFWGHEEQERTHFLEPTLDLIEHAITAGVRRFMLASTVAIGHSSHDSVPRDDFSPTQHTGFWPHLDRLVDADHYMREHSGRGMQMITMRLGHFAAAGSGVGLVPALVPRLRTYMVPWLAGGRARMPLVGDTDLGEAFALAATADGLDDYESFNIVGPDLPTAREVIELVAEESGSPRPLFSVPYAAGHAFGWLMERLHPVLPGSSPFLTRSLVHVAGDWPCRNDYASEKLGYDPKKGWRTAVREAVAESRNQGFPWPRLAQAS